MCLCLCDCFVEQGCFEDHNIYYGLPSNLFVLKDDFVIRINF